MWSVAVPSTAGDRVALAADLVAVATLKRLLQSQASQWDPVAQVDSAAVASGVDSTEADFEDAETVADSVDVAALAEAAVAVSASKTAVTARQTELLLAQDLEVEVGTADAATKTAVVHATLTSSRCLLVVAAIATATPLELEVGMLARRDLMTAVVMMTQDHVVHGTKQQATSGF